MSLEEGDKVSIFHADSHSDSGQPINATAIEKAAGDAAEMGEAAEWEGAVDESAGTVTVEGQEFAVGEAAAAGIALAGARRSGPHHVPGCRDRHYGSRRDHEGRVAGSGVRLVRRTVTNSAASASALISGQFSARRHSIPRAPDSSFLAAQRRPVACLPAWLEAGLGATEPSVCALPQHGA
jgi:hypothetical protein